MTSRIYRLKASFFSLFDSLLNLEMAVKGDIRKFFGGPSISPLKSASPIHQAGWKGGTHQKDAFHSGNVIVPPSRLRPEIVFLVFAFPSPRYQEYSQKTNCKVDLGRKFFFAPPGLPNHRPFRPVTKLEPE